jgi:hypothetical protein
MGVLANLNFIKEAAFFPCASPAPVLVMEAAAKAAFPVLLSAITFGCRDIVKMRAGISPWHARGMRALIEGAVKGQPIGEAGKLLKFTIPVEKALFFFFVVDLTLDFLARWQSQMFQLGACGPASQQCNFSGTADVSVCAGNDVWAPISFSPTAIVGDCRGVVGSQWVVDSHDYWQATFDITPKPIIHDQPIGHVQTRIHQRAGIAYNFPAHIEEPGWFGNPVVGGYMASGENERHTAQIFEAQFSTDVPSIVESGSIYITRSNRPLANQNIIPVNCFGRPAASAMGGT